MTIKKSTCALAALSVLICFMVASLSTAEDNQEASSSQSVAHSKPMGKVDPQLKKVLDVRDASEVAFLSKLSEEEQLQLVDIFKKRLDEEAGALLSIMATTSNFLPAVVLGKLAPVAGAPTAAKLSNRISTKRAIKIAKHTDRDFLTETTYYLDPAKVVAVMEACPDELMLDVARRLIAKEQFELIASFSDHVSAPKLKTLAMRFDDPGAMLKIAYHMKNKQRLMEVTVLMPDEYLLKFMEEIQKLGYFEMGATLAQEIDIDRQVNLLNKVDPVAAANMAVHYKPENIAMIMNRVNVQQVLEIGMKLPGETLGKVSNLLTAEVINQFWPYIGRDKILAGLPFVNLMKMKDMWRDLSPQVRQTLKNLSPEYEPLKNMFDAMTVQ